jgi:serine/threonine protein kinase/tetratricopeptide (TPR) repeat protein
MLGEYRIVREIGRGGMGVVYEAEQLSLGRRVALKVLPSAASLDPRQRQRFQVEAQAAALLHHEHIVPVFGIGFDQGFHYYAMQLIDGRPLTRIIQDFAGRPASENGERSSALAGESSTGTGTGLDRPAGIKSPSHSSLSREHCRETARLGVQAARALEHAHEIGVVHRDIKPSNLLLDDRGNLWVADFGLARLPQEDLDLTRTGDLVGTLRYMSPEQVRAQRGGVDSATDIYSLGVTLYELLTLRPAFDAPDRQELVRRILDDEPTRPRRINSSIPRDLETIILKSMEKEPSARYRSARDLADDLTRFLEDQPVQARRPSLANRVVKWSRRHRAAVVAGVTALILTLTTSTTVLWEAKRRTDASAAELLKAKQRADAIAADLLEAKNRTEGMLLETREALNAQFMTLEFALGTLEQIVLPLIPSIGGDVAHSQEAKRVLTLATSYYDRIPKQLAKHVRMKEQVAKAHRQAGLCRMALGSPRSHQNYREAIRLYEELATESPGHFWLRTGLIETLHEYSRLLKAPADRLEGEASFRRALAVAAGLIGKPEVSQHCYTMALAGPFNDLAWDLVRRPPTQPSDAALAVHLARQAIEWEPDQASGFWNTLGLAYYRLGDWSSAASALQKSMDLNNGGNPADWLFLAAIDHHRGNKEQARRWFDQSAAWLEKNRGWDNDQDAELRQFREEAALVLSK